MYTRIYTLISLIAIKHVFEILLYLISAISAFQIISTENFKISVRVNEANREKK